MGSLLLFVLGVAAPLAVAVAFIWNEDKRRSRVRNHLDRLSSDNRGLKMALGGSGTRAASAHTPAAAGSDREIAELTQVLSQNGILLDWLRLGTREPTEAAARLLGLEGRDAGVLTHALSEWGPQGLVASLDRLKHRLTTVAEMEMILADPHAQFDREAGAMAERVMWVFEPEYVVGEGRLAVDPRIGAIAKPTAAGGLGASQHGREGEPTLVVELKSARMTVGGDQQLQAWNNVRELIRSGEVRDRDPVDVFVIGGAVDEFDGNPRIEGRHRNVRITSYDYGQLIARAKRLTFGLYDELKDSAPFLRRHREAIAAEQEAAANQAAADAAPADEEEENVRPVDDHPVREEDYSDAPRRGEYDEDEDADTHKRAAE